MGGGPASKSEGTSRHVHVHVVRLSFRGFGPLPIPPMFFLLWWACVVLVTTSVVVCSHWHSMAWRSVRSVMLEGDEDEVWGWGCISGRSLFLKWELYHHLGSPRGHRRGFKGWVGLGLVSVQRDIILLLYVVSHQQPSWLRDVHESVLLIGDNVKNWRCVCAEGRWEIRYVVRKAEFNRFGSICAHSRSLFLVQFVTCVLKWHCFSPLLWVRSLDRGIGRVGQLWCMECKSGTLHILWPFWYLVYFVDYSSISRCHFVRGNGTTACLIVSSRFPPRKHQGQHHRQPGQRACLKCASLGTFTWVNTEYEAMYVQGTARTGVFPRGAVVFFAEIAPPGGKSTLPGGMLFFHYFTTTPGGVSSTGGCRIFIFFCGLHTDNSAWRMRYG